MVIEEVLVFNPIIVSFIAGFLAEEVLIMIGFLSGQGLIPLWTLFTFGLLGGLCIDSIHFFLGTRKCVRRTHCRIKETKYHKLIEPILKFTHNNIFLSLFITKFIYGPRVLMAMYLAIRRMKYHQFIKYDLIALISWAIIMLPLAYLAGRGILSSFSIIGELKIVISFMIIGIILYNLGGRLILRKLKKSLSKKSINNK